MKGEAPRLRSDGGPLRDFLYVEDLVDGYLKLLDVEATGPFNFGTGKGTSVMTVVETLLRLLGSKRAPVIDAASSSPGIGQGGLEIKDQVVDASKAERVLGWRPQHTLEEGLTKTIEWYRLHLEAIG